jgi:hypothetical protein
MLRINRITQQARDPFYTLDRDSKILAQKIIREFEVI